MKVRCIKDTKSGCDISLFKIEFGKINIDGITKNKILIHNLNELLEIFI